MSLFTRLFGKKASSVAAPPAPAPVLRERASAPAPRHKEIASCNAIPDLLYAMDSRSGYLRQAAIDRAVVLRYAEFLPALAARLNDWVLPVRDAARTALIALLPVMPPQSMLAILPALAQLRSAARHDHTAWLAAFEAALLAQLTPGLLLEGVSGHDAKIARACFQLLHRHAAFDTADLIVAALASQCDIVMAGQAAAMIHLAPAEAQPALYQATLSSAFSAVRAIGLRGVLGGVASDEKLATAMAHLFDRQAAERGAAITYFNVHKLDARAAYLQVLASGTAEAPLLQVCLVELGGMRHREDAATVRAFATHPSTRVRAAAYAALLKLEGPSKDDIATMALGDSAPSVRKLAMQMVSRHGAFIPLAIACVHLSAPQDWPQLMRLGANGAWDVIEAVARIAPTADIGRRMNLRAKLEVWLVTDASDYRPTASQAAFLRSDAASATLSALAGRDVRDVIERELARALAKRR